MGNPLRNVKPSPRVRQALWLFQSGACKSRREASAAAGLHPNYLTMLMNGSEPTKRLANQIQEQIESEATDMSVVLQRVGRLAVSKLVRLMDEGSESIQFQAAKDLADRSPETQKTQRLEVEGLSLAGRDAKQIAEALVEAAQAQERFADVARDGLVEIDTDRRGELKLIKSVSGQEPVDASEPSASGRVPSRP